MSESKWLSATKDRPCPVCGKTNRCRVAPDGKAAVCWREGNDGKVVQVGPRASDNVTGYIRKAHTPKSDASKASGKAKAFQTVDDAIAFAGRGIAGALLAHVWTYTDAQRTEAMRVARFNLPTPAGEKQKKEFRPVHPTAGGWMIGDPPGKLPLYRLTDLATPGTVFVCEGEKAADAGESIEMMTTTSAHGSSAAEKTDWAPLAGRDVVILPDNDKPGEKYARDVMRLLMKLDPPARVKVLPLAGLPEGGDIADYVAERGDERPHDIAAGIIAGADDLPWLDASEMNDDAAPVEPWPDPLPLPAGLPAVMPFDFSLLPDAFHGWVTDIAERMQCPPDYCAATAMVVAGALIGRKVAIRPKCKDDWQVVPNLYGMMVGRPSMMKTPAMQEVLKFLSRLEVEAKQEYAKALEECATAAVISEAKKSVQKKALKDAVADGGDVMGIAKEIMKADADEPTRRRFKVNDTTVEKLGMILAENPNGVLIFVDELVSFLRTMDREGHEADRGFYLMAWAGDSRYTYDRVGRGTLDIEAAIVSIVGSIQPGVIADYLRGAVNGGGADDGLMQRFQLTVWPDAPETWQNIDRYPDAGHRNKANTALERLAKLTAGDVQAERDNYERDKLPFLRFDARAQNHFDRWHQSLETRLRAGELHPALESHLAKYRSLIPSLALILHLLDGGSGPVSETAIEKAVRWGAYLESHARRLYAGVTEAPAVAARLLATRLQAGDVANPFAPRDVYNNGWSGLDKARVESAIDVLLSLRWLEERIEPTAGRARTRYTINPKIPITRRDEPAKPAKAPSAGFAGDTP